MLDLILAYLNKLMNGEAIVINNDKFSGSITSNGSLEFSLKKSNDGDISLDFAPDHSLLITINKFVILSLTGSLVFVKIVRGNQRAIIRVRKGSFTKDVEVKLDDIRAALAKK